MAETNFRGPVNNMGALEQDGSTTGAAGPLDGPSQSYQGYMIADIRVGNPFQKDGTRPGRQPAFLGVQSPITVDNIPQTFATNVIAGLQSITASGTLTLVTAPGTLATPNSQGIAVAIPIDPLGTVSLVTTSIAIDFGFSTGTTTANSTVVQVPDSTLFRVNQWICIGNVGNAAGTASLITQVTAISTTNFTTINVLNAPATAMCAPIGQANLFGDNFLPPATQFVPSAVPNNVIGDQPCGFARYHNPRENLARGVSVSVTAIASTSQTCTFLVTGYDVWYQLMTEQISFVNATTTATTVYGKKAFKFVQSVANTALGTTSTVSVGISDVFGLPIRADYWQHTITTAGNTTITNNVGFTAAVSTAGSPATNTTGDVRGTWQLSGIGGGTPISNVATSNGSLRLVVIQNVGAWNMANGSVTNTVPFFGNTQSIT